MRFRRLAPKLQYTVLKPIPNFQIKDTEMANTQERAQNAVDDAASSAKSAADKATEYANQAKHTAKDTIDSAKEGAKEYMEKGSELAHSAKDKASQYAHEASDYASDVAHKAMHAAESAYDSTGEALGDFGREVTTLIRKYPLPSLLVGFGVGLLLGRVASGD